MQLPGMWNSWVVRQHWKTDELGNLRMSHEEFLGRRTLLLRCRNNKRRNFRCNKTVYP